MARHPKKKQRLDSASSISRKGLSSTGNPINKSRKRKEKYLVQPLGSEATLARLLDEESKDDEEKKLESMLFGVAYVPTGKASSSKRVADGGLVFNLDDDDEGEQNNESGRGPMAGLLDSDVRNLCFR
jgi:U3 small nucleolar RNA-associated protein 18